MTSFAGKIQISTPVRIVLTCAVLCCRGAAAVYAQPVRRTRAFPRPSPEDRENIDFSTRADERVLV